MAQIKYIISDVDGCLSPEESEPWDLPHFYELARTIRSANQGESPLPRLTLCTGRPQPYVEVLMKLFGITVPAICENGSVLYTLQNNTARLAPAITEEQLLGLRAVRAFVEREILPAHPEVVIQFGKEAQLSIFSEMPELFNGLEAKIRQFISDSNGPHLTIEPSHFYLNISLEGVNKGAALALLRKELDAETAELVGIGDTEGDIPIRDHVGFFACPANARDSVKAIADYVSPYPTIEGVLDILKQPQLYGEQRGLHG